MTREEMKSLERIRDAARKEGYEAGYRDGFKAGIAEEALRRDMVQPDLADRTHRRPPPPPDSPPDVKGGAHGRG